MSSGPVSGRPGQSTRTETGSRGRHARTVTRSAAWVLVLALGTSGCTDDAATSPVAESPSVTATGEALAEFHGGGEIPAPPAELVMDAAARASAVALGVEVMGLFGRPTVSYEVWWAELGPLFSQGARDVYAAVDPANVPVTRVTGPGRLVDLDTAAVAIVHVPTDAGLYAVTLSRTAEAPTVWVAERITPPETVGD